MNAYELALHLQVESSQAEYGYVVDDWKLLDDAANMLRQQADRIAELEQEKIRAYDNGYEDGQKALQNQVDRITELETVLRSIANEPIELSHDKIKWQCQDHIRWAKDILK